VSSAISRIVIQSDPASRKVPTPGQVVGVVGKSSLFIVMDVDRRAGIVQLMEKTGKHRLSNVPFSSIRSLNRNLVIAIRRLLDSREEASKAMK
jgi:hypothetical protein